MAQWGAAQLIDLGPLQGFRSAYHQAITSPQAHTAKRRTALHFSGMQKKENPA